jgi:hypothetical protein
MFCSKAGTNATVWAMRLSLPLVPAGHKTAQVGPGADPQEKELFRGASGVPMCSRITAIPSRKLLPTVGLMLQVTSWSHHEKSVVERPSSHSVKSKTAPQILS